MKKQSIFAVGIISIHDHLWADKNISSYVVKPDDVTLVLINKGYKPETTLEPDALLEKIEETLILLRNARKTSILCIPLLFKTQERFDLFTGKYRFSEEMNKGIILYGLDTVLSFFEVKKYIPISVQKRKHIRFLQVGHLIIGIPVKNEFEYLSREHQQKALSLTHIPRMIKNPDGGLGYMVNPDHPDNMYMSYGI